MDTVTARRGDTWPTTFDVVDQDGEPADLTLPGTKVWCVLKAEQDDADEDAILFLELGVTNAHGSLEIVGTSTVSVRFEAPFTVGLNPKTYYAAVKVRLPFGDLVDDMTAWEVLFDLTQNTIDAV